MSVTRTHLAGATRIVVKLGSSSLTTDGAVDEQRLAEIATVLGDVRARGAQVVLVSSGAIAAGLAPLGQRKRPRDLPTLQAAASVGQGLLLAQWSRAFAAHGITVAQVLLTADDVTRRVHYRNARQTLVRLLELGALPVVNENDTVATEEIRFGDNDRLAALVAHLINADLLLLLSDVDGVYDGNPRRGAARLLTDVRGPQDLAVVTTRGAGSDVGSGGMASKIAAAGIAAGAGVPVVITRGQPPRRGARRQGDRDAVPPHRRPDREPAAVARARDDPARDAHPRPGCRHGRGRAAQVAPRGRRHRGHRQLCQRRSGRPARPGG